MWGLHAEVAGGAAIHALQSGEHYLVNLGRCCQHCGLGYGIRLALSLKLKEVVLIGLPGRRVGLPSRGNYEHKRQNT